MTQSPTDTTQSLLPVTPFDQALVEKALQDYIDGTSDKTLAETARSIITSISNPCAKIFDHKWLDPECVETGCQSLVWKSRYEAAVKGRQEFRQALRDERQAHPLPGDVGTAIDQAILWARDDKCSYPADAEKFEQRIEILRAALTPSPLLALVAGYADYKAISDDRWEQGKAAGYRELGEMVAAALTPSALSGDAGEVWQPIETCPMWAVAVVTDGISVAISQRAEADDGTPYWAIDPEDGLDWEPTYWVPALDEQIPSHQGAGE